MYTLKINVNKIGKLKVVAIAADGTRAGKSTVGDFFKQRGFYRLAFAETGKSMLYTLLVQSGYEPYEAHDFLLGDRKNEPLTLLGNRTPRQLMVSLMTGWGRNTVFDTIWVNTLAHKFKQLVKRGEKKFVIDDLRFRNEYTWLEQLPTTFIKVKGGEMGLYEGLLPDDLFDIILLNNGTKAELFNKVRMGYDNYTI